MEWINNDYEGGMVFFFYDIDSDPITSIKVDEFTDIEWEMAEKYKLAVDIGCDLMATIFPYSAKAAGALFQGIDVGGGEFMKLLTFMPSRNLEESKNCTLLTVFSLNEDAISLTFIQNGTIINHKTLISGLPLILGGNDGN